MSKSSGTKNANCIQVATEDFDVSNSALQKKVFYFLRHLIFFFFMAIAQFDCLVSHEVFLMAICLSNFSQDKFMKIYFI